MKASVIVPVYNASKYLQQCLDSLIAQSCLDFEIILIDDGSTDNSRSLCHEYAARDLRVQVICQENQGVSVARNTGIAVASAEYILFVDADDWVESNYVEMLCSAADMGGSDLVICSACFEKERGSYSQSLTILPQVQGIGNFRHALLAHYVCGGTFAAPWARVFRRKVIAQNSLGFCETVSHGEDRRFNVDFLLQCDRVSVIPDLLYHYRVVLAGLTFQYDHTPVERVMGEYERNRGILNQLGLGVELRSVQDAWHVRSLLAVICLETRANATPDLTAKRAIVHTCRDIIRAMPGFRDIDMNGLGLLSKTCWFLVCDLPFILQLFVRVVYHFRRILGRTYRSA